MAWLGQGRKRKKSRKSLWLEQAGGQKGMEEEMHGKAHRVKSGLGPGRNIHSSRQCCDSLSLIWAGHWLT